MQRKVLGLQRGVGYTDDEIIRARFYEMLERAIAAEIRAEAASMKPATKIGFGGRAPHIAIVRDPEALGDEGAPQARITNSNPLDSMFFNSKAPIAKFQWLAGMHVRIDFAISAGRSPIQDYDRLASYIDVGGSPRNSPSDAKIDAWSRLGRLSKDVTDMSMYLLQEMIHKERSAEEIARHIGEDRRAIGFAFRMSLSEAARHYAYCSANEPTEVQMNPDVSHKLGAAKDNRHRGI